MAATEANKLKRSKAANTRAAQAQTVLSSYSAGKEWQKHPAPMLLGALRARLGQRKLQKDHQGYCHPGTPAVFGGRGHGEGEVDRNRTSF